MPGLPEPVRTASAGLRVDFAPRRTRPPPRPPGGGTPTCGPGAMPSQRRTSSPPTRTRRGLRRARRVEPQREAAPSASSEQVRGVGGERSGFEDPSPRVGRGGGGGSCAAASTRSERRAASSASRRGSRRRESHERASPVVRPRESTRKARRRRRRTSSGQPARRRVVERGQGAGEGGSAAPGKRSDRGRRAVVPRGPPTTGRFGPMRLPRIRESSPAIRSAATAERRGGRCSRRGEHRSIGHEVRGSRRIAPPAAPGGDRRGCFRRARGAGACGRGPRVRRTGR